jgi:hypothetical protein
VQALVCKAQRVAATPIVRRVYRYKDLGQHRTWLDGRAVPLEPEIQQSFALAMSDVDAARKASEEMPLLSAAYRLTGDDGLRTRLLEQLQEVATWKPIQRPGWTCYYRGHRLPADGKDGNWLATGLGVRAIGDTLEILPDGAVSDALRKQLVALLESEIAGIVDDWQMRRPWFVRRENPITNQWVLPTEGLVRACLVLGADRFRVAYELGVGNLTRALAAHGEDGEFEEGIGYATFTVTSMLHAARAMAVRGDRRALDHPFLTHFPDWAVQHLQPGRSGINCFNAGSAASVPRDDERFRALLSLLAVCTGSQAACWALTSQFDGPSEDLIGLLATSVPGVDPVETPATYAVYERAARINWRSTWDDDATGVWVRGGHELDQHDDADRGHVNLIAGGVPILIEAGTPLYSHPGIHRLFCSGVGHNVLQLGTEMPETPAHGTPMPTVVGWQVRRVAPLSVRALNAAGGAAMVDAGACYEGVEHWQWTVAWTAREMTVEDDVRLPANRQDIIVFRWHLGTEREATVRGEDVQWWVAWRDAEIVFEASVAIEVTQLQLPDCTLVKPPQNGEPDHLHTCLVVRTLERVAAATLTTRVAPKWQT